MHYSDEELMRIQMMEDQYARQTYHAEKIQQSQERLANRKLEREVVSIHR